VTLRVLVADDHPLSREALRTALAMTGSLEVVGEAGDGDTAVDRAEALRPDVVVVDLNLPGLNGVEATREIVLRRPGIAVLMLTEPQRDESVFAAMRAGARGYLLTDADRQAIARAVAAVAQGEVIVSAGIASRVIAWFASGGDRPLVPFPELTDREQEILDLVARGLTNPMIAQRLFLPEQTVRHHLSNVFMKLQVADRSAAVARARDAGTSKEAR